MKVCIKEKYKYTVYVCICLIAINHIKIIEQ